MQKPTLVVLSGADSGKSHVVEGKRVTIGRDRFCDIHLDDTQASRCHARLNNTDLGYELEDLNSTNGTRINGIQVKRQRLYNGDQIVIGLSKFEALGFPPPPIVEIDTDEDEDSVTGTYSVGAHSLIESWSDQDGIESEGTVPSNFEALYRVGHTISASLDTEELLPGVLAILFHEIPAIDRASIHLRDEDTREFTCIASKERQSLKTTELSFNVHMAETVMNQGIGILSCDEARDVKTDEDRNVYLLQIRSTACVPLLTSERRIGVMCAESFGEIQQLTRSDLKLIAAIGNQAAIAIENSRLVERLAREKCALNEANEELKAAQEILLRSEKLALVGQLASGIVHELKNPIAVIQLSNETLKDQLRSTSGKPVDMDFVKELAGNTTKGIDMCRQVIDRLATYTRNRKDKQECIDVGDLTQEIIDLLHYEILRARVEVLYERASDPLTIQAEMNQIKQVFINIMLNAIQSMDKSEKCLNISAGQAEYNGLDHIRIRFQDNGKGMTKAQQDQMFEPFFTGHDTEATGRTGLGMSVSHGIVKDHLGFISVSSVPGEGTAMDVYLPIAERTEDDNRGDPLPHSASRAEHSLP